MPAAVEEKSMVPTVLVGIGGTGNEILSRLRRLIEEKSVILKLPAVLLKITKNTGPG